jgi:glycosyltransferase involved in cell wall biosynthesis
MSKVSVLIPSRNERFLSQTVDDIFAKATGEVEVVVHLDGYWPDPPLADRPGLHIVHRSVPFGMRPGINAAANVATGDYLMKCDAHCLFAEGFDETLKADCADNWVVVPRRYSLDGETWTRKQKSPIDYHYLSYPYDDKGNNTGLHGRAWGQRRKDRVDVPLDDEMTSQGSCWFMTRKHWEWMGGLRVYGYGDFIQEFQEVGGKTWLGGGAVKVNKRTWYAHLHKGRTYGRGYFVRRGSWQSGALYSADLWINNRWEDRIHDFEWLIEKFSPVPTWPGDWKERLGRFSMDS